MRITRLLLILASIAVIACFFVPYFISKNASEVINTEIGNIKPIEDIDITAKEMTNPSLFTYAKVYFQGGEKIFGSVTAGIFYAIIYILIPLFGLLELIFALTKKPIPALIFSIFLGAAAYAIQYDFESRRVIPSADIGFGIGYYILYACVAVLFIASILMIVAKHKRK